MWDYIRMAGAAYLVLSLAIGLACAAHAARWNIRNGCSLKRAAGEFPGAVVFFMLAWPALLMER